MDWHKKKKVARNSSRLFFLTILLSITYWLYTKYKTENLTEYERQNESIQPKAKRTDSITSSDMRASVLREIDSIKKAGGESQPSFYVQVNPLHESTDSIASRSVPLSGKNNEEAVVKDKNDAGVLQGPDAPFSHTYTIAVGKTIPVNILWANLGGTTASLYQLITVKVNDVADKKAKFTIEDPFNVLLFSHTGYAAGDRIIIEDDRHHLNISIVQITAGSAVIKVESRLTENLVSKLKKAA